jgi:hypothetical protein
MSRDVYERENDIINEMVVAQLIAAKYNVSVEKTDKLESFDWRIINRNGSLGGLLEIKCRSYDSKDHRTLLLSKKKWDSGIALAKKLNAPFYVAASFNGEVRWINACSMKHVRVERGGRTDRNDAMDMETCVHIPIRAMRKVKL